MSSPLEDGAARRSVKVTERPSGLDEPLVQVPSGTGFGRNAEPGAFRFVPVLPPVRASASPRFREPLFLRACVLLRGDTPTGDSGRDPLLRIFGSALVGGL